MFVKRWSAAAAAVVLVAAGCGGGGSSDPAISVTFSPSPLVSSVVSGGFPIPTTVRATVTNAPTGTVFAYLTADKAIIQTGSFVVTQSATGVYSGTINLATALTPSTYTGNLTLRLCKDFNCASEYALSGNTLPYSVTVTPQLALTATVNGVSSTITAQSLSVRNGDLVSVQATTPVTWSASPVGNNITANVTSQTTTNWTARLTDLTSASVFLTLFATPTAPGASSKSLFITVTP